MAATIFLIIILGLVLIFAGTAIWASWRAAPYLPTKSAAVRRILELAAIKPGERVMDLGAGDGRIVIIAAKEFQAIAVGYEISLLPYLIAKIRTRKLARTNTARICFQDFFSVDLTAADVVTCFLTPAAMKKLVPKLQHELKPGTRVISYAFHLPGWEPISKDRPVGSSFPIWVYRMPEHQ